MRNSSFFSAILAILSFLTLGLALVSCENPANSTPKPKIYTVTFDANGGTGSVPDPRTAQANTSITIPGGGGLSKTGYTFGGWNTEADGTGTNYSMGTSYVPEGNVTLYAKWNVIIYTFTFSANGGDGTPPSAQSAQAGTSITLPGEGDLTKTGYTFGGWNTSANGTGTHFDVGTSCTLTSNITLYAKWDLADATTYIIYFFPNGGSGTPPATQTVDIGSSIEIPNEGELTRPGYTFGGWSIIPYNMEEYYDVGSYFTPADNTILYARWIINYTVTFSANYGSGTVPTAQTVPQGSSIILPDGDELSRSGYIFDGWNTYSSGTGINYNAGSSYTPTGSIILYAKWNAIYMVTFSVNNGSGVVPTTQSLTPGSSIILPEGDELSRSGYVFDGWNTNPYGTGTNYSAGFSFTPVGSITLYARWVTNFTVSFNANNGSGTVPDDQSVNPGSSIVLPDGDELSRGDYVFDGWNTNANGTGTNYSVGFDYRPTSSITLYAKWISTVTYNVNNGSGTPPNAQTVNAGFSVTLPGGSGLSRTNYTFGGWNTESSGTGTNYSSGSSYTPTGNITLYVRWTSTVTYHINGGSGTIPTAQTVPADSSVTLSSGTSFSRTHYTFDGWNTNSYGTGTDYSADSSYTPIGNITLYAKWIINQYTIAYEANGGSGTPPGIQTADATSMVTLSSGSELSRTNYTFGGWNTNATGTGTNYNAGSSYTLTGNITLYARWTSTVTYNINGGSGTTPATQTVPAGSNVTLSNGNGLSRTNYTFGGWNTDASGTGTNYNAGSPYTPTGNITLYAKWTSTVTYNINGGSGTTPTAQTVPAGSNVTLSNGNGLSRGNYTFTGWNTNASGTGTNYNADSSYTPTGNITLYARWTSTITYNANGGSGTVPSAQIVNAGSSVTLSNGSGLSRDSFTFNGWNTNSSGSGTNYNASSSYTPTGNITLYARWTSTITYNTNGGSGTVPSAQIVNAGSSVTLSDGSGLSRTGYTFGGWNTLTNGTGTNYIAGSSYTPTSNITLYARWLPNSAGITFDVKQIIDGAPIIADITISRTNDGYPVTQTVSVNAADYDPGSIRWEVAGVGAYAGQSVTGSGASFTLNAAEVKYNSLGGHALILTVAKNGQQYQRAIPFTIVR